MSEEDKKKPGNVTEQSNPEKTLHAGFSIKELSKVAEDRHRVDRFTTGPRGSPGPRGK